MNSDDEYRISKPEGEESDLSIGCGTHLDRLDEPLILYPPRDRAIAGLHDRFLKFVLPICACLTLYSNFLLDG